MFVEEIQLVNGTNIRPGLFNVFIGGNGVGKSTLLIELFAKITNGPRQRWYWVQQFKTGSRDYINDSKLLQSSFVRRWEGANVFYYSQAAKDQAGNVVADGNLRFSQQDLDALGSAIQARGHE